MYLSAAKIRKLRLQLLLHKLKHPLQITATINSSALIRPLRSLRRALMGMFGSNPAPILMALSWEPVDGAAVYVIYMVDINANNFLHWKSADVTETSLHQGWAPSSDYVGPYPPSGQTHQYNIYVFALKAPVERVKGSINTPAAKIQEFMDSLDTDANGNTGNIVAVGRITGKYTAQ